MKTPFVDSLIKLAKNDSQVMLLTGDLGFGAFERFWEKFPKQFLNVGVAEQNMMGIATGLALEGKVVFAYSIANFATFRCLEQIRNDASYHGANVNVVSVGGGFGYGALGISHHATEDLSIMRALPDLTVVAPGDDWEVENATIALASRSGTGFLRLERGGVPSHTTESDTFEIGKSRIVRPGMDATIFACGGIVSVALQAAQTLSTKGIECQVVSMHTLKPLDEVAICTAAQQTNAVFTLEENTILGGLGGAVAETLLESPYRPKIFHRIGLREGFSSIVGSQEYLRERYKMDANHVIETVSSRLKQKVGTLKKNPRVGQRQEPSSPLRTPEG